MAAPFLSTFTLCAELVITVIILYVFYSGYKKNKFPKYLALFALTYEVLFNISYMVSRILTHTQSSSSPDTLFEIVYLAFHGTFSLIMFILLVVFIILAWKNYGKKINYFKEHKKVTMTFLILWLVSVLSGFAFYIIEYL